MWHLDGLPTFSKGTYVTVTAVEITEDEYSSLLNELNIVFPMTVREMRSKIVSLEDELSAAKNFVGGGVMTLKELATKLRPIIEQAAQSLDDETALEAVALYPEWKANTQYAKDTYLKDGEILYKVLQDHTSQISWEPHNAPSLFAKVLPGQEGTDIGEWQQPDSTNPYKKGDKVKHNGKTWESEIDTNVWEPGVYGWKEIQE